MTDDQRIDGLKAKLKQAMRKDVTLTKEELAAIALYDRESHLEFLQKIPKGVYEKLADRQQKVLNEQATRYKLPIGSATVNLYDLVKRFHDILKEWAPKVRELEGEAGKLKREKMEVDLALSRRKLEQADIDIHLKKARYIDRDQLNSQLDVVATRFRKASEQLGKRFGADAQEILNSAIQTLERELIDVPESTE